MTNEPTPAAPIDDVAQAFEALRGEVSLARAAVEGLTAARERIPDYTETLGALNKVLEKVAGGIARIERSPAASMTPAALAAEIVKAGASARAEDPALLHQTRDTLQQSIGRIDGIFERGQAADRQLRWLIWTGVGGMLMGTFLWSLLPGAVARALPASWHVPEWMAARTLRMNPHDAGARLIALSPNVRPSAPESKCMAATARWRDDAADDRHLPDAP